MYQLTVSRPGSWRRSDLVRGIGGRSLSAVNEVSPSSRGELECILAMVFSAFLPLHASRTARQIRERLHWRNRRRFEAAGHDEKARTRHLYLIHGLWDYGL